jgi:phage gp45-like
MAVTARVAARGLAAVANRIRGMFRIEAVKDFDVANVPALCEIDGRGKRELMFPFGFAAVPKASDSNGDAMVLTAGVGSDAVGLLTFDYREQPTDLTAGESRLYDANGHEITGTSSGWEVKGNVDADGFVDADSGFKKGGTAGKNGTLTIIVTIAEEPVTLAAVTVSGGLITGVSPTSPTTWVGD